MVGQTFFNPQRVGGRHAFALGNRPQTKELADPVLQVHHKITLVELAPVTGLAETVVLMARANQFVAPIDFRVGHHDQLGISPEQAARQEPHLCQWHGLFVGPRLLMPEFLKSLQLPGGAAKHVHLVSLVLLPATDLQKEFLPHARRNRRLGRDRVQWTKRVQ